MRLSSVQGGSHNDQETRANNGNTYLFLDNDAELHNNGDCDEKHEDIGRVGEILELIQHIDDIHPVDGAFILYERLKNRYYGGSIPSPMYMLTWPCRVSFCLNCIGESRICRLLYESIDIHCVERL